MVDSEKGDDSEFSIEGWALYEKDVKRKARDSDLEFNKHNAIGCFDVTECGTLTG